MCENVGFSMYESNDEAGCIVFNKDYHSINNDYHSINDEAGCLFRISV